MTGLTLLFLTAFLNGSQQFSGDWRIVAYTMATFDGHFRCHPNCPRHCSHVSGHESIVVAPGCRRPLLADDLVHVLACHRLPASLSHI